MDSRLFFHRRERLRLQKDIDRLFASGQAFISYPLRIVYLQQAELHAAKPSVSTLIVVPRKRIRHSVKRNRIKRLIRESFRLNKKETTDFFIQNGKRLHIAFVYISDDLKVYTEIEKAVKKSLERILRSSTK